MINLSVKLYLYGNLKKEIDSQKSHPGLPAKFEHKVKENETSVKDILKELKIDPNKISHIFVNGKYCGLGKRVKKSDRIGLFPRNMALNFVEIEKNNPIYVKIKILGELANHRNISEFRTRIPEGSTLNYLLQKLNLKKEYENLEISINGEQIKSLEQIIYNEDSLTISF
ncbi:MAG: hypothetical protein BAJALOKI2v1_210039 [Promethearchaeota archaeon]|nr:MAG: hypothetical protein BAJALOKI2v1_210039 [Candidatus Lokiarchaeota archaeon]